MYTSVEHEDVTKFYLTRELVLFPALQLHRKTRGSWYRNLLGNFFGARGAKRRTLTYVHKSNDRKTEIKAESAALS